MGRSKKSANKILPESPDKRKKKKSVKRIDKTKIDQSGNQYSTMKDRYIRTEETIEQIAKRYGKKLSALKMKAAKEKWTDKRKEFRALVDQKVDQALNERAKEEQQQRQIILERARESHFQGGGALMALSANALRSQTPVTRVCPNCKEVNTFHLTIQEQMNPQATIRAMQVGVDIQRKGLGLDDLHFHFNETKQVVFNVMEVIKKHVIEPDLFLSIKRGLAEIVKKEQESLDDAMTGGKTVDVLQRNTKRG